MRLDGKRVVITGASSGIGAALAEAVGARGAHLMLAARGVNRLQGRAATVALRRPGLLPPLVVRCDVADRDNVRSLCATAVERLGGLDVLINNAGICVYGLTGTVPSRTSNRSWR